jgi:SAM-dependent methyltransferase
MPSALDQMHLWLDSSARSAFALRRQLIGNRRHGPTAGYSGRQYYRTAEVIDGDGPDPLLRTGDSSHSLWRTVEWRLLLPIVANLPTPVMDLGCGDGAFGALFRERIDVGVDGDTAALGRCDPAVYDRAVEGDLRETLPVADGTLAAAFSNSTLEHVVPVEPALAAAARALRPGGLLVMTVPTVGLTRALTARYGRTFAARLNGMLGHHNLWTWGQWEERLRAAGFAEVDTRGYLSFEAIQWYASRQMFPWNRLSRYSGDGLWSHDVAAVRRLARESLAVSDERETTCVLIQART